MVFETCAWLRTVTCSEAPGQVDDHVDHVDAHPAHAAERALGAVGAPHPGLVGRARRGR
jgi:hypothetical protein